MIVPGILLALGQQPPGAGGGPARYWQQRLEYSITARLDEPSGVLGGTERVVYHNNSPDTLRTVSLHLYLNAFRPGSRWADADSAEHRRRFNDLRDPEYGFNRIRGVEIMGARVTAVFPFAPDSTVARFSLPRPAAPGDTFSIAMQWEARPSTVPRRQGRRGRHYDFAQWYPRVVAYDKFGWEEHPLYPAGEFYGDFGSFAVVLDVPEDEVVGATGVPLCGDPGWERANRTPEHPVEYRREFYGAAGEAAARRLGCGLGMTGPSAAPGRKRVVWYADLVHHFAMSMSPDYRYEGGRFRDVAVHVLYQPGARDDTTWGHGRAVGNTSLALQWLDALFGPFAWPQLTNVHRIEGGGTEYPMMVHDGSAGLGLIVHEVGHNYLMGILANNEWREGFLDEGFTSFQTSWFEEVLAAGGPGSGGGGEARGAGRRGRTSESAYGALEREIVLSDLDGWSEPVSLVSERYRDFRTYQTMIYDRGELFYEQLRRLVGDSVMVAILRTYYERWKLRHVDEAAFRAVAEEVSGRDLSTFFGQWLHGTVLYDYAVGRVKSVNGQRSTVNGRAERRKDGKTEGGWRTQVEVVRKAPGIFPVDVVVRSASDSAVTRADGAAEREWVELTTAGKPREVEVDPWGRAHDWNLLDNRKKRGLLGFATEPRRDVYLDRVFSDRIRRNRLTVGLLPTIWYNDQGGVTLGGRARTDYLGRFEQNVAMLSVDTRRPTGSEAAHHG
ncbi:MAG: hypothetical protein DMD43_09690, partial [Gemmatimonadetes bacterium]